MPSHRNYVVTAADTVRRIRGNLREYAISRDATRIFRELTQNAEDAKDDVGDQHASSVHFVWVERLDDSDHPLLSGPLLLAVNDGPFSTRDEWAMRRFG